MFAGSLELEVPRAIARVPLAISIAYRRYIPYVGARPKPCGRCSHLVRFASQLCGADDLSVGFQLVRAAARARDVGCSLVTIEERLEQLSLLSLFPITSS